MFKKLLLVAVIGAAGFALLRGTKFFGLAKQEIADAQSWLDDQVPVDKEIKRLRGEIASLEKDRLKVGDVLAKEIVDVRYLKEDIDKMQTEVATDAGRLQDKADIVRRAEADAKDRTATVKYDRAIITVEEAKARLKNEVAHHTNKKATLNNMEKQLAIRESNKEYLEKQLSTLKMQKDELTVQVDALAAQFEALKLEQMQNKYQTDPTRLARIKESVRALQRKADVEREKLNLSPRVREEVTSPSTGQSVDEIMAPVDGKGEKKVTSTK